MRVFVAGGTGALGRRLVPALVARGHEVVGLAGSAVAARALHMLGAEPAEGSVFDLPELSRAMEGVDVVVNAASAFPRGACMRRRAAWVLDDRIRVDGTRALATAAGVAGAGLLVQRSRVGAAAPGDAVPVLLRSTVEADRIAQEVGQRYRFDVAILRSGMPYGPDEPWTRRVAAGLSRRRIPLPARWDMTVAPVHLEDLVAAWVGVVEVGRAGDWDVVDDRPLDMGEWMRRFSEALGAPRPHRLPLAVARAILGPEVVDAFAAPDGVSNASLRRHLAWRPGFPTVAEGLADAVARWARPDGLQPPMIPLMTAATASPT